MEDNRIIYLIGIAIVIILLIITSVFLFFYFQRPQPLTPEPTPETNVNGNVPILPSSGDVNANGENGNTPQSQLAKEKQFISSFYQPIEISYTPAAPTYPLPIENIKEQVVNYRDFSRKIKLESALPKLGENGFVVMANPFSSQLTDWESNYKLVKENDLPIFISSDSIIGLYQDTLHLIYKETEQEIFYSSLWGLLNDLYNQTKFRYESRYQQFGIETDIITEANRLEMAYLGIALKLLSPEPKQIKEAIGTSNKYFSPQEASVYKVSVPEYLTKEIDQEIELISTKAKTAASPIFLYQKSYLNYEVPPQYQTSEKLKNYYLAITWLNDVIFPLWYISDDCPNCLLDEEDQKINFLAGLYLSHDLASNQNLKNRWANIYKSISFFKGLENNLTYLDYHQALESLFGANYQLDEIFSADAETVKKQLADLRGKISSFEFTAVLGGSQDKKEQVGLKLLRNYYLLEDSLFHSLSGQSVGQYLEPKTKDQILPFTACPKDDEAYRCLPSGLDLFNLLGNETAKGILTENKNDYYEFYGQNLDNFKNEIKKFDQYNWHDNSYLALLASLKNFSNQSTTGLPTFMQTTAWAKKSLNTGLAAWVANHREINFEKTSAMESGGLIPHFPYGYIEPQVEIYSQLLANTQMVMDGFKSLQIILPSAKSAERLENLKIILQRITAVARQELENEPLTAEDYSFINNFDKHIRGVMGDVQKAGIQNKYSFSYQIDAANSLDEYLDGINYIIVIYPDQEGKMFFAIGPVFNYSEGKNKKRVIQPWQEDFKL
ncbi:MAG: DUF3160 domain-containing protein [Patescibacteria group bacterium]|jgi:hypothetical protein